MKKPHPLAKTPPTHFKVRNTGMVITAATRDRWERQQLARALEEFPDLPKGPKRPRLNSRRKRRRRNQAPPIVVDEFVDPILRTFVHKKRRARSKKNRQARIDRVVQERAVQMAARAKGWFRIGRGR